MKKILFLMIFSSLFAEEAKIYESRCISLKSGRVVFSGNYALHNLVIYQRNDIICDIEDFDRKINKGFKRFKGECR